MTLGGLGSYNYKLVIVIYSISTGEREPSAVRAVQYQGNYLRHSLLLNHKYTCSSKAEHACFCFHSIFFLEDSNCENLSSQNQIVILSKKKNIASPSVLVPSMALITFPSVGSYPAILLAMFVSLLYFLVKLYRVRSFMAKLQMQGLVGKQIDCRLSSLHQLYPDNSKSQCLRTARSLVIY